MRLRTPWTAVGVAMLCAAAAGCGTESTSGSLDIPPPTATAPATTTAAQPAPIPQVSSGPPLAQDRSVTPLGRRGAWRITTYYTVVQDFHGGPLKAVRGCPRLRCNRGRTPLGSYPAEFLKAIQTEGSGRITSGPHRGRYLNWSHSVGYWLDDSTRDSAGRPLQPWASAAADRSVLARGRRFAILECGGIGTGRRPVEAKVCETFRAARWTVTDLFRPGFGGEHHADVYIGEETGPGFKKSPFYTTLRGATIIPS